MSATGLSYTIAGPADDEDYAQAEYLAEMLMVSLPSIHCTLKPIMPIDWNDFVKKQASFLGCKQRAPLIWTNSGAVIGGLPEFTAECEKKYGLRVAGVDYTVWPKVAKENLAAAKKRANKHVDAPIGSGESAGTGSERGAAVAEELLFGNARYLEGSATTTNKAKGPLATPAAVVVCLTPLPVAAHVLLGCEESSLFVVPCTASGIETLAIGNIEYGCLLLKAKAVLLLGAPTPEFASYVHAAKERKLAKDGPLSAAQDAVLQAMLPALSRTLAAAPPRCTPQEVTSLCLEEWVRECADELLRESPVLATLLARKEVHVERGACGADGAISVV